MPRRYNTKHDRSPSRYPLRLARRGMTSAAARMPYLDSKGRETTLPAVLAEAGRQRHQGEQ